MQQQVDSLIDLIQGDKHKIVLGHRILNMAIALIAFIIVCFWVLYIFSPESWEMALLFGAASLFYACYFVYSRFYASYTSFLYWTFIISTLFLGVAGWLLTAGWKGATPIAGVMALLVFLATSTKKHNRLITLVVLVILSILFFAEYHYSVLAIPYPNEEVHFWDVVITSIVSCLITGFIVDTLQKSYNEERQKVEEQNIALKEALQKLKETQEQLIQAEKMAGLGTMAAGIAHEINNPINFVYTGAQALEAQLHELEEEVQELIAQAYQKNGLAVPESSLESKEDMLMLTKSMKTGAERVAKLVSLLGQLSNYRSQKKVTANIADLIDEAIREIEHPLKKQIKVTFSNQSYIIPCYPSQLKQAFIHLFMNGLEAIEETKGTVEVFMASTVNELVIYIQDNGCGIPEHLHREIFDPFFTTKMVGEGIGLGLSLTYDIILYHQGRITISSQEGKGTTVAIFLSTAL